MTDEIVWTTSGRAALAAVGAYLPTCAEPTPELIAKVATMATKYAPSWERGEAKSDDVGAPLIAYARKTWGKGKAPKKPSTVEELAGMATLFGANGSAEVAPYTELVVRERGFAVALEMLAAMWSMASDVSNYDKPKIRAVSIVAMSPSDGSAGDASVSYGKSAVADYLARAHRSLDDKKRAAVAVAMAKLWPATRRHAKPTLVVATQDRARAAEIARELIAASETEDAPYHHYAWQHLPYLVEDVELLAEMPGKFGVSLHMLDTLGIAALPLYEREIASHIDKHARARLLGDLVNVRGPRTAKLIAEYAANKPYADQVRAYFTTYPELLDGVMQDPDLVYHRDSLRKLLGL